MQCAPEKELRHVKKIDHSVWRKDNWTQLESVYPDVARPDLEEYVKKVFMAPHNIFTAQGYACPDTNSEYINISGRRRITSNSPANAQEMNLPRIFMFGDSRMFGAGVEDAATIPSIIQSMLNKNQISARVVNCGIIGNTLINILSAIRLMDFRQGDLIVLFMTMYANYYPIKNVKTRANYYRILKVIIEELAGRNLNFVVFKFPDIRRRTNPTSLESFFQDNLRLNKQYYLIYPGFRYSPIQSVNFIDTQAALNAVPVHVSCFWDFNHMGPVANGAVANFIYPRICAALERCKPEKWPMLPLREEERELVNANLQRFRNECRKLYLEQQNRDIEKALAKYREYPRFPADPGARIGSIIMNCNPFTFGHVYLVEEALKQVDFLYLFIVSEDKSIFPFRQRFAMVQKYFASEERVKVLPSGHLMASTFTFPEYFNKEDTSLNSGDGTLDTWFFRDVIAPVFGITHRFLGTEPRCVVTARNNELLKRELSQKGIKVVEIERKTDAYGKPLSASTVRSLMRANDYAALRPMVPDSTYEIICQSYQKP